MTRNKLAVIIAMAVIFGLSLGATAMSLIGDPVRGTGTNINRVKTAASEERFSVTTDDGRVDLPGARHRLVLGQTALVIGRFSAATRCVGVNAGPCAVAIVVIDNNTGNEVAQLLPTSNPIDSAQPPELDNNEEGHALERSITLPPGDYDFQVALQLVNLGGGSGTFHIAGWHFTVERIVP